MDSIQRYNEARRALRETYVWNLRELARVHAAQPRKPAIDKAAEADRLYNYYVSRVRDVFEEHRCDHRRLFGQDYLYWAQPEREDHIRSLLRGRTRSRIASRIESSSNDTSGNSEKQGINSTNTEDMKGEEGSECVEENSGNKENSVGGTGDRVT